MKTLLAIVIVPVMTGLSVMLGWAIQGASFQDYVPYYVLGGAAVGVVLSMVLAKEKLGDGRVAGDYIETVARRDAQSAAFRDLVIVLLVSSFVFSIVTPNHGLAVYVPMVAALALADSLVRQRRLNVKYAS